jgi:hypothetical protein
MMALRAAGFRAWAVGQRDAAGEAPDECAGAGDRSNAPVSSAQPAALAVSRVNFT